MGTRITAVELPSGVRRGHRANAMAEGDAGAAPVPLLSSDATVPRPVRRRLGIYDAGWEIVLNQLMVGLMALSIGLILALWPFIGGALAVRLVLVALAGMAYFGISWLSLRTASSVRLRWTRWINSTIEASIPTIGFAVIALVKGPAWAAASPLLMAYVVPIVMSGARLRPGLSLYVTGLILVEHMVAYYLLVPRLDAAEVAAVPSLAPWSAWARVFWLGLGGALVAAATYKARGFAIFGERQARETRRLEKELGRYVSRDVAGAILRGEASLGSAERRQVTVLFCDLRDFTAMCEQQAPEEVVALLNRFYGRACRLIEEHGGTVNKFLGDGLLALFGAPDEHPNHARAAAEAAHDILAAAGELRALGGIWRKLDVGIGLDTGDVVVGGVGAPDRLEYTAIGSPVNRAARLQSLSRRARHRIILSRACVRALGSRANVVSLGELSLKGFSEPEPVYAFRHC